MVVMEGDDGMLNERKVRCRTENDGVSCVVIVLQ
jgi:hypothetical protein